MKKPYRQADGFYHVDDKKYKTLFGSREQVMNGTVHKTTGGLTKDDLVMNKWGRIVSAKKFKTAKKEMRLQKYGFFAKKGKFGAVSRKLRGGKVDDATPPAVADVPAADTTNVVPTTTNTNVAATTSATNVVPAATTNVVPTADTTSGVPAATTEAPATTTEAPATTNPDVKPAIAGGKSKKQNKSKKRR